MRTGADGLLAKPLSSVAYCQKAILELLLEDHSPVDWMWYAMILHTLIPLAYQDDMAHIADDLADPTGQRTLDFVAAWPGMPRTILLSMSHISLPDYLRMVLR